MEEVRKLQEVDFIREVYYLDWLANVVMVKNANGKWRICMDFTDLNRACPKDSYPLLRINILVDLKVRHQLLSFMDAFSGYNQIMLDKADQEKSSFITSQGLFCYKVMPFELKNVGVTYQRLMNKMFTHQIGRNVQVCVDDMLVKSIREEDHLNDLQETLEMTPPANIQEVQSLNGKVAARNRFISREMDKCLPFFRTLKKSFEWTAECQQAFEDWKA